MRLRSTWWRQGKRPRAGLRSMSWQSIFRWHTKLAVARGENRAEVFNAKLVVYESASGKHYLYDVTQIERGGSTQYSMHWTPPLSGDTIHQLFGISNEIRGSFTPGEKFAESFQAVIELVKGKANVSTLCHESAHWLKALILETAAEKGLEVTCVHTTELKHFATGNGRAEKGEMVKAAFGLSGRLPRDDNEADALL